MLSGKSLHVFQSFMWFEIWFGWVTVQTHIHMDTIFIVTFNCIEWSVIKGFGRTQPNWIDFNLGPKRPFWTHVTGFFSKLGLPAHGKIPSLFSIAWKVNQNLATQNCWLTPLEPQLLWFSSANHSYMVGANQEGIGKWHYDQMVAKYESTNKRVCCVGIGNLWLGCIPLFGLSSKRFLHACTTRV